MADSKHFITEDLTQCGICLSTLDDPKALPCLHSYCLKCLAQWAKGRAGAVKCPICCQDFPLPKEGVKGFRTNFLINALKERRATLEKLQSKDSVIPCSSCGAIDKKAEAYCSICRGFVCKDCIDSHGKLKNMSTHKLIPFEDLKSGKVDIRSISQEKFCKTHNSQVVSFYCETCGVPICRDCTVVDHPASTHVHVDLETATKGQKKKMEQLLNECESVQKKLFNDVGKVQVVLSDLEENTSKTDMKIDATFDEYKNDFLKMLEEKKKSIKAEAMQEIAQRKKQLEDQRSDMQHQQAKFYTALQMATELTKRGSTYDLALSFSSLKTNLSQLRDVERYPVNRHLGKIDFNPRQYSQPTIPKLGTLVYKKKGEIVCKIEEEFGKNGEGTLTNGRGITLAPNRNIVVANMTGNKGVVVYKETGQFKYRIDTNQNLKRSESPYPYGVAVSSDGRTFVTQKTSQVHVYDESGAFLHQFPTISPDNVSSDKQNTQHMGIAIDNQGNLLIAEVNKRYISKHQLDGAHITSIKMRMAVWYIAVSLQNKIVVSGNKNTSNKYEPCIQILDSTGKLLSNIRSPTVLAWNPHGLCCTDEDEVYISSCRDAAGIYRYSLKTGSYLGCITKDVNRPTGLAMANNHDITEKLLVAQHSKK